MNKYQTLPYTISELGYVVSEMTASKLKPTTDFLAKTWSALEPISLCLHTSEEVLSAYFGDMQSKRAGPEPWLSVAIARPKGPVVGASLARKFKSVPKDLSDAPAQLVARRSPNT